MRMRKNRRKERERLREIEREYIKICVDQIRIVVLTHKTKGANTLFHPSCTGRMKLTNSLAFPIYNFDPQNRHNNMGSPYTKGHTKKSANIRHTHTHTPGYKYYHEQHMSSLGVFAPLILPRTREYRTHIHTYKNANICTFFPGNIATTQPNQLFALSVST